MFQRMLVVAVLALFVLGLVAGPAAAVGAESEGPSGGTATRIGAWIEPNGFAARLGGAIEPNGLATRLGGAIEPNGLATRLGGCELYSVVR